VTSLNVEIEVEIEI